MVLVWASHRRTPRGLLDAFYPRPLAQVTGAVADTLQGVTGHLDAAQLKELASAFEQAGETGLALLPGNSWTPISGWSPPPADNAAPDSVEAAYLKLHLISHRLVKPHETDLTGLFGLLPNVAWTDQGPIDLTNYPSGNSTPD